ncbi:rod shape-determining protein MreC [Histidinibacterium aquaticum]|uniref:Cell shape-determining protein MreC n=1 Tax=Histidinibacterium aquaticum TaxID=2613962 RepID=A0A5J5GQQ6_9RHOB|nr:rod shape-determining protein MreC [Histidinibacterium aquaticum]KAA9010405.1 rod shape-determining protein MreC [Histidinibacterium aquaticum]
MARERHQTDFIGPIRRLLIGILVLFCLAVFLVWRIDSPRVERFRAMVVDRVVPSFDWAMAPVTGLVNLAQDFESYQRLAEQNADLRRELQQMKAWREAALQLEQENAKLRDLNQVSLDPELTWITGVVLADSGSPFRQSVLLNVGRRDGILDGWPVMDGIGLVGRVSGVGADTSRAILLTDTSSRIPVTIQPSGQRAILAGDNTVNPPLMFLENDDLVRPGDRVVSSGDGGVFPADLLVGQVALGTDRQLRVRLAADYERLEFLRVMRSQPAERISETGALIAPVAPPTPDEEEEAAEGEPSTERPDLLASEAADG